jgi:hypothetical protein
MLEQYDLDSSISVLDLVSTLTKCQEYQTSVNYKLSEVMNKFGHFVSNILVDTPLEYTHDNPYDLSYGETYEDMFISGDEVRIEYSWYDSYSDYESHSEIRVPLDWLVRFDQGDDEDELSEEIIKHIENITLQKERDHLQYIKDEAIRLGLMGDK